MRLQPAVNMPIDLRQGWAPATQVGVALAVSAVAGLIVAATGSWPLTLGALGAVALAALGLLRPAVFLMLCLLFRPLMDEVSRATLGIPSLNLAGGVGLLLIALTVVLVTTSAPVFRSPPLMTFGLVLALSAAGAYLTLHDFGAIAGVTETVRLGALLGVYLLAASVLSSAGRIKQLYVVIGLSGVIPAVLGVSQLFTGVEENMYGQARISGPFVGPNPLGLYCALTALTLIAMPRGWLPRGLRTAALAPILVALVASYSREAWIVFLLGLVLLEWRQRAPYLLGALAVVAALVITVPSVQERILPTNQGSAGTYSSYGWRIANWRGLLEKAAESPLIGHGTQTTVYVNPYRTVEGKGRADGGAQAHNALVRILVEGGLVLLTAYVVFMVCVLRRARDLASRPGRLQPLAKLVAVIWIVLTVVALGGEDPFDNTASMFAIFAMTAALDRAGRLSGLPAGRGASIDPVPAIPRNSVEESNG